MIYNPAAGRLRGKGRDRLNRTCKILEDAGYVVSITATGGPGAGGETALRAIEQGAGIILAAGGDGTLNEIAAGMVNSPVPLGIIPAGTANVLATEIGLGSDLERAAAMVPRSAAQRIGVGRVDFGSRRRYFLAMAGMGFDAQIVYGLSGRLKIALGKAAYWVGGFAQAVRMFPEFEVEVDGGERHTCSFALVSRVRNYGGDFSIARHTSLLDDCFELVLFRGRNSLPYLKYLCGMVTERLAGMRGVSFLRTRKLRVYDPKDRRVYVQVDGEYAGRLPAAVEMLPGALTLLMPANYLDMCRKRPLE